MNTLAFIQNIGMFEWCIILVVALLLFGKRLPEVGRSLGKGIVEFKKGIKGVEEEVERNSTANYQQQLPLNTTPGTTATGQPNTVSRADGQ